MKENTSLRKSSNTSTPSYFDTVLIFYKYRATERTCRANLSASLLHIEGVKKKRRKVVFQVFFAHIVHLHGELCKSVR